MDHLVDNSVSEVRRALEAVAPELVGERILVAPVFAAKPRWYRASCFIGDRHVLKVCWSAEASAPLLRQSRLFTLLTGSDPRLPLPVPIGVSEDPVAFAYELVPGRPLTYGDAGQLEQPMRRCLASDMADALAALHDGSTSRLVTAAGLELGPCRPQATSAELRERLVPGLEPELGSWLGRCLDRVDEVLDHGDLVVVHGDFHGHNLVFDHEWRLRAVLDLEETALGPREYDLRYLPAQAPTFDLHDDVVAAYRSATGHDVDLEAVLAWHVLTDLGDALWRTEAGVEVVAGPIEQRTIALRRRLAGRAPTWT